MRHGHKGIHPCTFKYTCARCLRVPVHCPRPQMGWPLPHSTYGGGFIYHMGDRKVALGLIISLSYDNPHLNTFQVSE